MGGRQLPSLSEIKAIIMSKPIEIAAKLIILGDTSVGKSSIILRYFENTFEEYLPNTIGAAFQTKEVESVDHRKLLKMHVWDTCGQERFMSIASVYYKDANVILLVIDASQMDSLEVARKYFDEIQNHGNADPIIILVVNKIDLFPGYKLGVKLDTLLFRTCPFYDKIQRFVEEKDLEYVFWTSAKENGANIPEMFDFIATSILTDKFRIKNNVLASQKNAIGLSYIDPKAQPKKCC